MSNVLVIGSGGREHAISWKLSQSSKVKQVYVLPGNGGTSSLGTKVSNVQGVSLDPSTNFQQILQFVKDNQISLVFVGPEQPLVDGISDVLKRNGVPSFGPSSKAANIEASKAFSKDFMSRHKIPTAEYKIFTKYEEALDYLNNVKHSVVLKASGLAAGKGVLIPENKEQAIEALKTLMVTKPFGKASDEVVIEQRLEGPEVSVLAFTDGYTVSIMPPAQDHKRIGNDDTGENTGGMGAYAPAPLVSAALLSDIKNKVIQPTIDGLRKEGKPYVGVIYAGILLDKTTGINVLEFNCRFGDPETQVLLPLLQTDLYDICEACVEGRLDSIEISWKSREFSAVTVVMASKGYPGTYETNKEITGLNSSPVLPTQDDLFIVFHAGTKETNGRVTTSGGRVLNVTYVSKGLETSVLRAYEQIKSIHFDGAYYRTDIALKALKPGSVEHSGTTYKDSGVDIDSADNLIDLIGPLAKATARTGTDAALGGFGGLFDLKATGYKDPILVSGTDGVGTKLLIAQAVGKHDTIGIDLVAMSVNDILVQGAEPLFFLDYYATGKLQVDVARDVIAGVADGCKQSMCALIGGETAEMPGMYPGGKYDLAGFAVGVVERDQVLPKKLDDGDILIGLHSSGVHSNGFSLVRHVIEKNNLTFHDPCPFDPKVSLGVALLAPTRLYVKACMPLLRKGLIKAMAHITGGGIIENLPRVLSDDITAEIDLSSWPLPPVFQWLSKAGKIEKDELIRTFNCGIGLVVAIKKSDYEEVASTLKANGEEPRIIGSIVKRAEKPVIFKNNWKTQTAFH